MSFETERRSGKGPQPRTAALHIYSEHLQDASGRPDEIDLHKDGNPAVRVEAIMKTKNALLAAIAALTAFDYSAATLAAPPAHGKWAPIEGTWIVTINPVFCTAEPPFNAGDDVPGVPKVTAYLTFGRGGTLTETNSNANFEPGQRGPGHGYWERTGQTSYQFAFQAFIQFDSVLPPFRYKRGYQRLDQTVELHTDDEFTTSGPVQFFNGTATTDPYIAGCARSEGTRLY
jgi:hypothetical protein